MPNDEIPNPIDALSRKWGRMDDVQRGLALQKLDGQTSLRALAKSLHRSESLLRNLVHAGRAPLVDRILAQQGRISTRELVRRSKAAVKIRSAAEAKSLDRERRKKAQQWSEIICEWLETQRMFCSQGEDVVDKARRELFRAECTHTLPLGGPAKDLTIQEIIQRSRPRRPESDEFLDIDWYGTWLGRWTYFAIPDTAVRDRALGFALNKEMAGERERVQAKS